MPASRRGLLHFSEYIAVSAVVLGAIATFKTQQPMYAIAPLTVVTALSVITHRQATQQLDKTAEKLSQQVLDQLPPIHAFDQLNQRLDIVGQQGLRRRETLDNLTQCVAQQTEMLQSVTLDTQAMRTELTEQLTTQFTEQLTEQKTENQAQLSEQKQAIESVQLALSNYQEQIAAQIAQSEQTRSQMDALSNSLRQAIAQINAEIATMNTTLESLPTQTDESLAKHKAQLDDQLTQMQQSASEQQSQMSDKNSRLEQLWIQKNAEFSETLEHLTQELMVLSTRVDDWENLDFPETEPVAECEPELQNVAVITDTYV